MHSELDEEAVCECSENQLNPASLLIAPPMVRVVHVAFEEIPCKGGDKEPTPQQHCQFY